MDLTSDTEYYAPMHPEIGNNYTDDWFINPQDAFDFQNKYWQLQIDELWQKFKAMRLLKDVKFDDVFGDDLEWLETGLHNQKLVVQTYQNLRSNVKAHLRFKPVRVVRHSGFLNVYNLK